MSYINYAADKIRGWTEAALPKVERRGSKAEKAGVAVVIALEYAGKAAIAGLKMGAAAAKILGARVKPLLAPAKARIDAVVQDALFVVKTNAENVKAKYRSASKDVSELLSPTAKKIKAVVLPVIQNIVNYVLKPAAKATADFANGVYGRVRLGKAFSDDATA